MTTSRWRDPTCQRSRGWKGSRSKLASDANDGDIGAMLLLAFTYGKEDGNGPEAAFRWYVKAAEAGNVEGMVNAASCYATGCPVNVPEACKWYEKAASIESEYQAKAANLFAYYLFGATAQTLRE